MEIFDCLIIGGGIAGTTAAETYRRYNADASIVILNKEPELLYSRVLLFQLLKHEVSEEQVFMRKLEEYQAKKIDIRTGVTVTKINTANKPIVPSSNILFFASLSFCFASISSDWFFICKSFFSVSYLVSVS